MKITSNIREEIFKHFVKTENATHQLNKSLPENMREKFAYRLVVAEDVPLQIRGIANRVLERCKQRLKMPEIEIQWIQWAPKPKRGQRGYVRSAPMYGIVDSRPNTIAVRWDIPLRDVMFTVAHEAHHLWFKKKLGEEYSYKNDEDMWEDTANGFAGGIVMELEDEDRERDNPSVYHPSWPAPYGPGLIGCNQEFYIVLRRRGKGA